MLNLQKINLKGGKIIYNNYAINPDLPFKEQAVEFNQNLILLNYFGKYYISLDWLPVLNPEGRFIVSVVEKDWDNPLYTKEFKKIAFIEKKIQESVDFVSGLIKKDKEKFLKKIDLRGLKIVKDDITFYEDSNSDDKHEYHMKIASKDAQYTVDVAWLPFETSRGLFTVRMIINRLNQPQVMLQSKTKNINKLHKKVQEAIDYAVKYQDLFASFQKNHDSC